MYGLKYFFEIDRGGHNVRLNVYQRNYDGVAKVIGDLQHINLEAQGANGSVVDPIVKTSLVFAVADTADKEDTATTKYGSWEEFYTPDATLYKVELKEDDAVRWTGYVTPDSWNEGLQYHGSISVTARDNIGHLSDFDFDKADLGSALKNGYMVSVADIVKKAMAKVEMPMELVTEASGDMQNLVSVNGGVSSDAWMIDVRGIDKGTWYEALEGILASVGMCLRYCDNNRVVLMSIRSLPLMGATERALQPHRSAQFLGRSGNRTLDPAYKEINETLKYEAPDDDETAWDMSDFTEATVQGRTEYILNGTNGWGQSSAEKIIALPPYSVQWNGKTADVMFRLLAVRDDDSGTNIGGYMQKEFPMGTETKSKVSFSIANAYWRGGVQTSTKLPRGRFKYALVWVTLGGNIYSYINGAWVVGSSVQINEIECPSDGQTGPGAVYSSETVVNVDIEAVTPSEAGRMYLRFYPFALDIAETDYYAIDVQNITVGVADNALPKELRVKTVYDEKQNYKLKRDVDFGEVPTYINHAGTCINGIYQAGVGYPSVHRVTWAGDKNELPLSVANHLQILAFNAKANSLLSGDLRDTNGLPCVFNAIWHYGGRQFLLQSGNLDVIKGTFSDTLLREYNDYSDVWDGAEISYKLVQGSSAVSPELVIDENTTGGGGGEGTISVNPSELSFVADGEPKVVDVLASGPFGVEAPSWLSVTINGSQVTLTASANGTASRRGSVRFYLADGKDATCAVSQEARQVVVDTIRVTRINNRVYDYQDVGNNAVGAYACDVISTQPWTASIESGGDWIEFYGGTAPSGAAGTTTIYFNVLSVNTGAARQAVIVARQPSTGLEARFYCNQAGGASATSLVVTPSGTKSVRSDETSLDLNITSNVSWRVTASVGITLSKSTGNGNDTVTAYFAENVGTGTKTMTITVATTSGTSISRQLTISQAGKGSDPSKYFYTDKSSVNMGKEGGSAEVVLSSSSAWTASSPSSWCTVSPTSGTAGDSKTISFTLAQNTGGDRQTTVTISGPDGSVAIKVTQKGIGDSITLSSGSGVFDGGGELKPVTVTASAAWTARCSEEWVTINPEEGVSGAVVGIEAAENSTQGRTAKVIFTCGTASAEYTITQLAQSIDTQLGLSPKTASCGFKGDSGAIEVTANAAWEIVNVSEGLTFSVNSGSGSASVTWYAAKNTGVSSRRLTATFRTTNGERTQTFSVDQSAASVSLNPSTKSVVAGGLSFDITVTASDEWTAGTSDPWLSFVKSGNTLRVSVAQNEVPSARSGQVTVFVAGTEVRASCLVEQAAAAVFVEATPAANTVNYDARRGTFVIRANKAWEITDVTPGMTLSTYSGGDDNDVADETGSTAGTAGTVGSKAVEWEIPTNLSDSEKMYRCKVTTIGGEKSIFVTVTCKSGNATITVTPDRPTFISQGQTPTIKVASDLTWNMVCSESWLKFEPTRGSAGAETTVTLSLRAIPTGDNTGAVLTITSGTAKKEIAVVYLGNNS